jgi:hypothetical protein
MLLGEQNRRRADRVEPHEAAGGHECEREEENARISASVGRLACRVSEREGDRTDDAEDHEVELVVLDVRIELRAEQ